MPEASDRDDPSGCRRRARGPVAGGPAPRIWTIAGGPATRIWTIAGALAGALALTACAGVGSQSPTESRPPSTVNLAVYVNDSRVLVSPRSIGAGPVLFVVTNHARQAESLAISASGDPQPLASTAPINPQGTTQVQVTFKPGDYTIATAPRGETDADLTMPSPIQPASLHIGHERASADNQLLQP
jgi:hypothetical protein